jgi:DNA-3-methyladenine glycosylase
MSQNKPCIDGRAEPSTNHEGLHRGRVLEKAFFDRPTPMVACDLLGKTLVHETREGLIAGRIVETEAYLGLKDPACHASAGETKRTKIFYEGSPGTVYVFSSFGIYNCMNVLTSGDEPSGCVLLRAVEPLAGLELMKSNRRTTDPRKLTSGPGKLTRAFGISKDHNGHLITERPLVIRNGRSTSLVPAASVRIGITKAWHYPLRFFLRDSPYVSRQNGRLFSDA